MAPTLVHLGQVLVDLTMTVESVPPPGGDVFAGDSAMVAGGGTNLLTAARRMGASAVHAGALGTGSFADICERALAELQIPPVGPVLQGIDQGFCVALTDSTGERTFISTRGAETYVPTQAFCELDIEEGDLLHLCGYSLTHEETGSAVEALAARGIPEGTRAVFDISPMAAEIPAARLMAVAGLHPVWSVNETEARILASRLRPEGDLAAWVQAHEAVSASPVSHSSASLPSASAAPCTRPTASPLSEAPSPSAPSASDVPEDGELCAWLSRALHAPVIVRIGPGGAWWAEACSDVAHHVPAPRVDAIDTNGAGDAHCGVLEACLLEGKSLGESVLLANCAAALATTQWGPTTCPSRGEIEALASEFGESLAASR